MAALTKISAISILLQKSSAKIFQLPSRYSTPELVAVCASYHRSSDSTMSKTVLALLATGTEEMELVISIDVLRRAGVCIEISISTFIKICHRMLKPHRAIRPK